MVKIKDLNIKIFSDGANLDYLSNIASKKIIKGFTTNPTLINNNNITDFKKFAKKFISKIKGKSVSFEVTADSFKEMERQAHFISSLAPNIYVKIPITNTKKISTLKLIKKLTNKGVNINITAVMTIKQINQIRKIINKNTPCYISIFAGRISDTGVNPMPIIKYAVKIFRSYKNIEIIWASPRQIYNLIEAEESKCHIITLTEDLLNKLSLINKNLDQFSLETVKMFYRDAVKSGIKIL